MKRLLAFILVSVWFSGQTAQAFVDSDAVAASAFTEERDPLIVLAEAEVVYQNFAAVNGESAGLCEAERDLAQAKIVNKDFLELTGDEIDRLYVKTRVDCSREVFVLPKPHYRKVTADETQNQYVSLASEISGNNLDFILTVEQENGLWTIDRVHGPNRNGTTDHGFCGLNSRYHWNFITSPEFLDPKKQLEYCYSIFQKNHGRFYGYYVRNKHRSKFVLEN